MIENFKKTILNINIYIYVIIILLIFKSRYISIIYPYPLNPDEAQMVANSLRIKFHGYNWDAVDGTTSGPLNNLILIWPNIFGWDSTLSSARITASILIVLTCIFLYKTILLYSNIRYSIFFILPIIIFYCLTENNDFLHYSSEILPVFTLILANYLILNVYLNNKLKYLKVNIFMLGLTIGIVPFTKLQATPIAFIVGLFSLHLVFRIKNHINAAFLASGLILPTLILLLPLFFNNSIHDFWTSYLGFADVYVKSSLSLVDIHKLISGDIVLKNTVYFIISFSLILFFINPNDNIKKLTVDKKIYYYFIILLVVALFSIAKPGNSYSHYLLFLLPFLILSTSYISYPNFLLLKNLHSNFIYISLISFFIFLTNSQVDVNKKFKFNRYYKTIIDQKISFKNPEIYSWIPINIKHILIWAWMPQWYAWSNSTPAIRETNIYGQVVDSKLQEYFRLRFLKDFDSSKPELVIDGTRGNSFGFNNPEKHSPKIFPEFNEILNKEYTVITPFKLNKNCPKLYIKNEYIIDINNKIIFPKSVTVTGINSENTAENHLFDMSVTEDTCTDYWLLPDDNLGSIIIKLKSEENISNIMIMNTKNSSSVDRESKNIEVNFYNSNKLIDSQNILLNSHPNWTNVIFNKNKGVDEIIVNIKSFNGRGAGLNEIILLRKTIQ